MRGPLTHYDILGVAPDASGDVIRRAYHRKARELHPDRRPGGGADVQRDMQAVNEAWRVLRDPVQRAVYDRRLLGPASAPSPSGSYGPSGHGWTPPPPHADMGANVVRGLPWLLLVAALVFIFVFTAYARTGAGGSGPSSMRDLVGRCVHVDTGFRVEATPCTGDHDGQVVLLASSGAGCPGTTTPQRVAGESDVLCLDTGP